jgi:hypothetical protein
LPAEVPVLVLVTSITNETEFPEPNAKFEKFAVAAAVAPDEPTGTLQVIVKSDDVVMATAWA